MSADEELEEILHMFWMNDDYHSSFLPTEEQKMRMIQKIEKATVSQPVVIPWYKSVSFIRTLFRVAAIFIFALLSGICIHLYRSNQAYRNNQNVTVYKDNEITLNVGNGQEAEFILPDGTSVRLNSGSTLRYTNNFGENNRLVNFAGEAFFKVKQDKDRPFIVSTKHIDIEVLGTSFNLYAFDDSELIEMTLLTGSVKASSNKKPEHRVFVNPNEKVICDVSTGELSLRKTNALYETAWLNGELVFKSETLNNVLAKMERKYGTRIRYEGSPGLLEDRFSGRIDKNNNIGDAMKILIKHYPLKYELKGDTFVLSDNKQK